MPEPKPWTEIDFSGTVANTLPKWAILQADDGSPTIRTIYEKVLEIEKKVDLLVSDRRGYDLQNGIFIPKNAAEEMKEGKS